MIQMSTSEQQSMTKYNPFDAHESYDQLKRRAEAGDGGAAYTLVRAVGACREVPRDETSLQETIDRMISTRSFKMGNREVLASNEEIESRIASLHEKYPFCSTLPKDEKGAILSWLMIAGNAGILEAQYKFVRDQETEAVDASQDVRDARVKFLQSLDTAAAGGNAEILENLWELYDSGKSGLPQDSVKAYAYLMAGADIHRVTPPGFREGFERVVDDPNYLYRNKRDQLSPNELHEAEPLRSQIVKAPGCF